MAERWDFSWVSELLDPQNIAAFARKLFRVLIEVPYDIISSWPPWVHVLISVVFFVLGLSLVWLVWRHRYDWMYVKA